MSDVSATALRGRLRSYFDRGGFWRLVPLVVVYLAIYLGAGLLASTVFARQSEEELLTTVGSVFVESGEFDGSAYAAEGHADVFRCITNRSHLFAWEPPFAETDRDNGTSE